MTFVPAYTTLIVATKARDRYWDGDAVRTDSKNALGIGVRPTNARVNGADEHDARDTLGPFTEEMQAAGAPLLDWWRVPEDETFTAAEDANMGTARYIVGDCMEVLASLEPGSVDLVMSSPPFLALRSYLPADHPDKAREIGSEATPGEFIDTMLDVVEACARVLAPHGSLVFELGDTYSGSTADGGDNRGNDRYPVGRSFVHTTRNTKTGWPLDKSKVLIPQLFAIALAYGFNPLTGRETDPWRVRNTVAWCRPNPPVGRDGDKFRPATSFLTVATKARDRYWDGDAVRVPPSANGHPRLAQGVTSRPNETKTSPDGNRDTLAIIETNGAPLLDWWEIPTAPYKGSHYATYPPALVVPVVKAMCPERVCRVCGKPSTRITEPTEEYANRPNAGRDFLGDDHDRGLGKSAPAPYRPGSDPSRNGAQYVTLGWSDCFCHNANVDDGPLDKWRPGMVLDPFGGSGTTLQVATGHGRDAIGIDLDSRNAELAVERIGGLFLTVEHFTKESAA